jgi:hypothetical protein
VCPRLFRHTLAQGVLETTGNIKVAQEILGHSHLSTTADLYLRVDQHAMVAAFGGDEVAAPSELRSNTRGPQLKLHSMSSIMTIRRSRNWNAPLRKLLVSSQTMESLDISAGVCTHIMPHKSN